EYYYRRSAIPQGRRNGRTDAPPPICPPAQTDRSRRRWPVPARRCARRGPPRQPAARTWGVPPPTRSVVIGGLTIAYDDRVLEPRPWTVLQSRWAAELARDVPPGPILELFAGVGHIGLVAATACGRELVQVD